MNAQDLDLLSLTLHGAKIDVERALSRCGIDCRPVMAGPELCLEYVRDGRVLAEAMRHGPVKYFEGELPIAVIVAVNVHRLIHIPH